MLLRHFSAIYLLGKTCILSDASSSCCNGQISTDVVNATAVYNERPALTNQYNWAYNTSGIIRWTTFISSL